MTQIILARHGQTVFNKGEVFRGRIEIDLDEAGLKQATLLSEYLAATKVEAVYCSPRTRALRTAQVIAARLNLTVQPVDGLDDIGFGRWEGKPVSQVREEDKVLFTQWMLTPHLVKLPGGESLDDVTRRAMALVQDIAQKHKGAVVLVSHQVVHKCLILAMLGLDNASFWKVVMDTAAITTFDYRQNTFVLKEHNNVSYLKGL
ncbi:MAG: histidine phosphatase family protein [Dehalococcoidales bacterium]|nr:histidine phosphatase family protein [Dehalococcoidales bacterium]